MDSKKVTVKAVIKVCLCVCATISWMLLLKWNKLVELILFSVFYFAIF